MVNSVTAVCMVWMRVLWSPALPLSALHLNKAPLGLSALLKCLDLPGRRQSADPCPPHAELHLSSSLSQVVHVETTPLWDSRYPLLQKGQCGFWFLIGRHHPWREVSSVFQWDYLRKILRYWLDFGSNCQVVMFLNNVFFMMFMYSIL